MLYYKLKSFIFSLLRISNIDDIRQPSQNTNAATSVSYFIPPRRQRSNSYPNFRSEDHLHSNTGQTTLSSTHPVRLYLSNSSGQRNVPVTSTRAAGTRDFFLFSPFFLRFFFTFLFFFFVFVFCNPKASAKFQFFEYFSPHLGHLSRHSSASPRHSPEGLHFSAALRCARFSTSYKTGIETSAEFFLRRSNASRGRGRHVVRQPGGRVAVGWLRHFCAPYCADWNARATPVSLTLFFSGLSCNFFFSY